jgi:hypothetical protein
LITEHREESIQAYAKWLKQYNWAWFGTLRIMSGVPADTCAWSLFDEWIAELRRVEGGPEFRFFCVLERGTLTRHRHFHVVVGGFRNRREEAASRWNWLGGDALLQRYDPQKNGLLYLLKSMTGDGNLEMKFQLPRLGREFAAAPEGVFPSEPTPEITRLRIGNLSEATSPGDLRKLFSRIGPVSEIKLYSTGEQTFALMEMPAEDAAEAVEVWNGHRWHGQKLRIELTR